MFAEVYLLRREGVRLAAESLVPIRGRLRIEPGLVDEAGGGERRTATARVHTTWPQPFPGHAAATLHDARVTRLDERGFVIVGREVVMSGLGAAIYPQAWACKLLAE